MNGLIALRCPKCNCRSQADRQPEDARRAMELVIICPRCDDGDFHSPQYFSAAGKEILWGNPDAE